MLNNYSDLPPSLIYAGLIALALCFYFIIKGLHTMITQISRYQILKENKTVIENALADSDILMDLSSPYFNNYKLITWREKYKNLFVEVEFFRRKIESDIDDDITLLKVILTCIDNSDNLRRIRNDKFIENELISYSSLFDNIEGNSLDIQQRIAAITNEDNNLVIAGAGTGKTSSIVGKVAYILERYKTSPERILVISFTNKSAKELRARINNSNINITTFHKLGKDIIHEYRRIKQRVYEENNIHKDLETFIETCSKDDNFRINLIRFIALYMKPITIEENETKEEEKVKTQKRFENGFFRNLESLEGKQLKSQEEVKISDFLSLNQVTFKYEEPYEIDLADYEHCQYKPDFAIYQDGKVYYLEHFGIDKFGNPPNWFKDPKEYKKGMKWKRKVHYKYETTLLETYSFEIRKGNYVEVLTKRLTEAGIKLNPMSFEEFKKRLMRDNPKYYSDFIKLFTTFLNLLKSNNYNLSLLKKEIEENKIIKYKERAKLFLELFEPIFNLYELNLQSCQEIDFSDMIREAITIINESENYPIYDFIIVDEFQDMSKGRYELLKALKNVNPHCIIFGVGDDWQSIFRFTGSDIGLFNQFEENFGISERLKIETTYRFSEPLIQLSSDFIMKNSRQIVKQLKSNDNSKRTELHFDFYSPFQSIELYKKKRIDPNYKYYHKYYKNDNKINYNRKHRITHFYNIQDTMINILDALKNIYQENLSKKKFLILGRYNHDINKIIFNNNKFIAISNEDKDYITVDKYPDIVLEYLTIHRAKGLEADIVFLINCEEGVYGFPSGVADDPLLNLILTDKDNFRHSEERRLFYVALTRAKEHIHLLINCQNTSAFIKEFNNGIIVENNRCPLCKTGLKVQRRSSRTGNMFWSCTNWKYGCSWTEN